MAPPAPKKTVMVYGRPKIGKTLDVCYTFGKAGYVILSEPDGLSSVEANLGYTPDYYELTNIANPYTEVMTHLQKKVLPEVKTGRIKCIIFDTGSEFADRLLSAEMEAVSGQDKRRAYQPMYQKFGTVMRTILLSGAWVAMICHEKRGDVDEDKRGGPLLPGRLVESVPSQFSLILRAAIKTTPTGRDRVYLCDQLDGEWLYGDRYGACFDEQPMELRAIMWRIAHPDADTPAELLMGKPIRYGGKRYEAGTLPKKKTADLLADLDSLPASPEGTAEPVLLDDAAADAAPVVETEVKTPPAAETISL